MNMFREWNLAEEVACHVKGAEDMPTAWRMLDAVYDSPPARTMDQTPEAGRASEPQEEIERGGIRSRSYQRGGTRAVAGKGGGCI